MAKAPSSPSVVRIGLLGCGNVGAAFVQLVERQADIIEARTGVRLQVVRVAVRNVSRDRDVNVPEGVLTRDAHAVVSDPTVDLVVERVDPYPLVIGVLVGIFQAATSINEMTLSFVPKLIAVMLLVLLIGSWQLQVLVDFTRRIFERIPDLGQ